MTTRRLAVVVNAGAALGVLLVILAVRGCRGSRHEDLETRVARIEDLLGLVDAGAGGLLPVDAAMGAAPVSADDRTVSCAVARVAAYRAWTEAIAKEKVVTAPAQAACADKWSDANKQACYYAATATIRTSQTARDALMTSVSAAREAVKGVKDDPKNDALARARTSADAVLQACDDDGG
jgi:hypothetical protein